MKNVNNPFRKQLAGMAAAVAIAGSGGAYADATNGIVDIWEVGVVGSFVCPAEPASVTCGAEALRWGIPGPNGQSGLDLLNRDPGTVVTDDIVAPFTQNITVTHLNRPVFEPWLDRVTLVSALTLTPTSPAGPVVLPNPLVLPFLIEFLETPNQTGTGNTCPDGGTEGQGVNSAGCADIFVIDKNSLDFPFVYDLGAAGGNNGPKGYFISFFEETNGLNPLSDDACINSGVATGCLGFLTPEGQDTPFTFVSVITTRPLQEVPVPGTLAVMGLGLLGLGAMRRRRAVS